MKGSVESTDQLPSDRHSGYRGRIQPGDIRRAHGMFGVDTIEREVLIVRKNPGILEFVEIWLLSRLPEPVLAGDIIIPPEHTGLDSPMTVHSQLRGVVWDHQLSDLLTHLPVPYLRTIDDIVQAPSTPSTDDTGYADDDSYSVDTEAFLAEELDVLWSLTGDCMDALLDEAPPWQIDTDLLSPSLIRTAPNRYALTAEVHHFLLTRPIICSSVDLWALGESDAFEISKWEAALPGTNLAVEIVKSLSSFVNSGRGQSSDELICTDDGHDPILGLPARIEGARQFTVSPTVRLLSAPFLWSGGSESFDGLFSDAEDLCELEPEILMLATPTVDK